MSFAAAVQRLRVSAFVELTKPRIASLVSMTAAVGYLAGAPKSVPWTGLAHLIIGTALAAGGASALNQTIERNIDGKMRRTMLRPIPSRRVTAVEAGAFGCALSGAGCAYLWTAVDGLAALLAALTLASYLGIYTPLKRITSLNTVVGAVPGALPPVGGWAAARGSVGLEAWILFAILFLWQLPHFLAIAWIYRDDYARADLAMLPCQDNGGAKTGRQVALYTLALTPVSLAPCLFGMAGAFYFAGALALGCAFTAFAGRMAWKRSAISARRLLTASLLYLPLLLGLLILDRYGGGF